VGSLPGSKTLQPTLRPVQPHLQTPGVALEGGRWARQLWGHPAKPGLPRGAVGERLEAWGLCLLPGLAGLRWLSSSVSSTQGNGSRHSATEGFLPVEGPLDSSWLGQLVGP